MRATYPAKKLSS